MCSVWEITEYESILKDDAAWFAIYPLIMHVLCDCTPIMEAVVFVKCRCIFTGLHEVIFRKKVFFLFTAATNSSRIM